MHEYKCSCHINGKSYDFETTGCSTATQAYEQFANWLFDNHKTYIVLADGMIINKVEVDE